MLACHFAHSRIAHNAPQVSRAYVAPSIAFLGHRQDSVGADMDVSAQDPL